MTLPRWQGPKLTIQKDDVVGALQFRDPQGRFFTNIEISRLDGERILQDVSSMLQKGTWSAAEVNDLPDSAFLYVEGGGTKDGEGKTTPRSLRHFPYKDKDGKIDLPHLRNALARIPQAKIPQAAKDKASAKARHHLEATQKAKMPTVGIQGIAVTIDRPKGTVQTGVDHAGIPWTREYLVDYGFIRRTQGGDGESLDVYCGPNPEAPDSYWIFQIHNDGTFDEFKVMMGFNSVEEALACYRAHTPDWCFGRIFTVPVAGIKALLNLPPEAMQKALTLIKEDMSAPAPGGPGSLEPQSGNPTKFKKPRKFNSKLRKSEHSVSILKDAPVEEGFVLGVVLVPEEPDLQNDIYSEEEIRMACHDYMANHRNIGDQHKTIIAQGAEFQGPNDPVTIVENYCAPADFMVGDKLVKKGTWLMGARLNDPTYREQVKSGAKTGFSIGGDALRSPEVSV